MPLDQTTYIPSDHSARSLTADERQQAREYLGALDAHWTKRGADGWFQGAWLRTSHTADLCHNGWADALTTDDWDRPHCFITPAGIGDLTLTGFGWAATAMGFNGKDASDPVSFNNAEMTTFAMVHARVKEGLATLDALDMEG